MAVRATQEFRATALLAHSAGWRGAFPAGDPTHGANTRLAEYNGLLNAFGPSQNWVLGANATRGEVAQLLYAMDSLGKPSRTASHPFVLWENGVLKLLNEDGTRTNLLNLPKQSPVAWSADGREVYYVDNQMSIDIDSYWDLMALNVASKATRLIVKSGRAADYADRFDAFFSGVVNPRTGEIYIGANNTAGPNDTLVSVTPVEGVLQRRSGSEMNLTGVAGAYFAWDGAQGVLIETPEGFLNALAVGVPKESRTGREGYHSGGGRGHRVEEPGVSVHTC